MTDLTKKLDLDEDSLVFLLNFILDNIKEDRQLALQHHDTLSHILNGAPGDLSGVEMQLLMNDLSQSLTNFLNTASLSTERAIKIAKILADLMTKMEASSMLTENDRESIEEMVTGFQDEQEAIDNNKQVLDIDRLRNGT